jgi:hypothetical protein
MNEYNFKFLKKNNTINDTQIDHICTNALIQQCHSRSTQAYWTNHKPIYFAFKPPNYVPQFVYHIIPQNDLINF